jgi:uncharacterized protein YndB with AHSA1/START domain
MNAEKKVITIRVDVKSPVEEVWFCWTTPKEIMKWNFASDDWHTTSVVNDLTVGGKFSSRMEAKDGSMGFDFWGTYDGIIYPKHIAYTLGDERKVKIDFISLSDRTEIIESFEAENENTLELQQKGWQSILDNFKKYVENSK